MQRTKRLSRQPPKDHATGENSGLSMTEPVGGVEGLKMVDAQQQAAKEMVDFEHFTISRGSFCLVKLHTNKGTP